MGFSCQVASVVLGAVEYLVAGLALLRTEGCLTLVGSSMEVHLVVMLGGAEDIARFAHYYLGSSLGKMTATLATLAAVNSLLYASRGGVRDAKDGAAWNLSSVAAVDSTGRGVKARLANAGILEKAVKERFRTKW